MEVVLTNMAGLWALLGVPAVIAIHLLQRRSREALITTRFLLEQSPRESVAGRKLERLRASIPLWLQLLLILLLTWLLVAPRWKHATSVQRTAVVLDASASMQAFRDEIPARLGPRLRKLASSASRAEFVVLDTTLSQENIYHGPDPGDLLTAIETWTPLEGEHDIAPSLQVASSLVGNNGAVILVTDRIRENLSFGARLLAIGKPIPNCGFTGLRVHRDDSGEDRWSVLLRNYGDAPATRSWHLEVADKKSPPRTVTIEAASAIVLKGSFPPGANACTLRLEPDTFTIDDNLPVIRAAPKPIYVTANTEPAYDSLYASLLESLREVLPATAATPADLTFATYNPVNPSVPDGNAVVAIAQRQLEPRALQGAVTAARHPLMAELSWQGLLCRSTMAIPARAEDEVLLWQGERPLIFLRTGTGHRQLIFNFDLTASNASRLPATVVLLHRFVESLRASKVALERANVETGQDLALAFDHSPGALPLVLEIRAPVGGASSSSSLREIDLDRAGALRAPREPGFFRVTQDGNLLLEGAAHFADPREGDFREAASRGSLDDISTALVERHTREDPLWKTWVALLGALLLINWHFTGRGSKAADRGPSTADS